MGDFHTMRGLEWIETNGLGGYASSTVSGAHSRRYHGLLVAATEPPAGRIVLLSKLDETVIVNGLKAELSANQYPGVVHPEGFTFLESFERFYFPEFTYRIGGVLIHKTIASVHGSNTTIVLYKVLEANTSFEFQLLPLYAARDIHSLAQANDFIGKPYIFQDDTFRTLNYRGCPEVFIAVPGAEFIEAKTWYRNFEYYTEQERGMDYREDLYTHGYFTTVLRAGDNLGVIISSEDPTGWDAGKLLQKERNRRIQIATRFEDETVQRLALAADQFIVKRGDRSTIVAGYHWFTDWGRDTMISLPGLCLCTGRFDEAKEILLQFSSYISEGMIPNRFRDFGETPEYNTIDATLWYFVASFQYYMTTCDRQFANDVVPVLREIIEWHYNGTRYNIKVDPEDQLLSGGEEGVQLTWMDAKVGDWVVTPRKGKAVEINALWYNALSILAAFLKDVGEEAQSEVYRYKARKVSKNFNALFWNEQTGCLYDYVNGTNRNDDIRPNQLYAISLPFTLLSKEKSKQVFEVVSKTLFTPRGLRSLARDHRDYKSFYTGDIWNRDGAYHQGTVWGYLIGPYIDALFKVKGTKAKNEAAAILKEYLTQLDEAGVGSISEIFDADQPHIPRGCIAQAWSVAEALRVIAEYKLVEVKKTAARRLAAS